ncbi:lipid A biosynthesis acyltransferase [Marinomonas posidonica]|uniref:lipid A biosynthesis acyltransferase n=1 Tax=Marinomonas posidonica TaxID=936476 RepID=UPI00030D8A6B|nr:lipid A biosynthesis acyltransferase [Marinomonas posidonica]
MVKLPRHWSKISETGSILGMKILLACYRIFGRNVFRITLLLVIGYYYLMNKHARQASQAYLKKVKPLCQPQSKALTPFRHFWTFGELLLDKFLVWMGHIQRQDIIFHNKASMQYMNERNKGGIIVVSHLGNTEICSAIAHQMPNIKVTMLVHTKHAQKFNRMLKQTNANANISVMQVTDMSPATAMTLSERVEAGEYIIIAGDRTPVHGTARTTVVQFLQHPASFPQGAFILAGLLKCPVFLMFCLKQQNKYHIYIELFSEQLMGPRKTREQRLDNTVKDYAKRLEHYCLMQPLQWFNFYDFWYIDSSQTKLNTTKKGQT